MVKPTNQWLHCLDSVQIPNALLHSENEIYGWTRCEVCFCQVIILDIATMTTSYESIDMCKKVRVAP